MLQQRWPVVMEEVNEKTLDVRAILILTVHVTEMMQTGIGNISAYLMDRKDMFFQKIIIEDQLKHIIAPDRS